MSRNFLDKMEKNTRRVVVGVTGHTGCGKSTATKTIEKIGKEFFGRSVEVVDVDLLTRKVRDESKKLKKSIIDLLGNTVYDENGKSLPPVNSNCFDSN
jgi:dephospho-CoA kinase